LYKIQGFFYDFFLELPIQEGEINMINLIMANRIAY